MESNRPGAATLGAFALVVAFLGSNFVFVRFSNDELAPFWGAAFRFLIASAVLWAIVRVQGIPLPRGRGLVGAALFGLLAFSLNFGLLYWGLVWVPAGLAAVIYSTIPLTTFAVAVLIRLERFRWPGLLGALIVVAGIGSMSWQNVSAGASPWPLVAVILASLAAALSGIVIKAFPKSHPLGANAIAMPVGAAVLLGASFLQAEPHVLPALGVTWGAVVWLAASSVIAFSLMIWVIGRWTASANAYGSVLAPLVTLPLAAWLRGEPTDLPFLAASLLVLWGVYVGAFWRARPRPVPAASPNVDAQPAPPR